MLLDVSVKRNGRTLSKYLPQRGSHPQKGIRIININVSGSREPIFRIRRQVDHIHSTGSAAHFLSALGPVADLNLNTDTVTRLPSHSLLAPVASVTAKGYPW